MRAVFNKFYNKQTDGNPHGRTILCWVSVPFILSFLALDSQQFAATYFDGRNLVNFIVICFFFIMLSCANSRMRRLILVMVPLSYIGEQVVCNLLDMYDYRENRIPLWVPFAHGILYGYGIMFSQLNWAKKFEKPLRKFFIIFFLITFAIASFYYFDILTFLLAILFFHALNRKKWNNLYFFVSMFALMAEYAGTFFGIWTWDLLALGFIPTLNPPAAAIYIYIGGDAVLLKLMRYMDKRNILRPIGFERPKEIW